MRNSQAALILPLVPDRYLVPLFERRRAFERALSSPKVKAAVADLADQGRPFSATCPACGYPTLHSRNHFNICSVCGWEDDGQDDPEFAPRQSHFTPDDIAGGPNYSYSLSEARFNFAHHLQMYRPFDVPFFEEMNEDIEHRKALVAIYNSTLPDVNDDTFINALPSLVSRFQAMSDARSARRAQRRLAGEPSNKSQEGQDPSFILGEGERSSLRFDCFSYQGHFSQASADHFGSDWLCGRVYLTTRKIHYSRKISILISELAKIREIFQCALSEDVGSELTFESLDCGSIALRVARSKSRVAVTARLKVDWAGPILEYPFECEAREISTVLKSIDGVLAVFPERSQR